MAGTGTARIEWVDYAKGFCIIMVVMMHSTLGVERAAGSEGWLHSLVEFARPFRMPDFFLIAGLFLARVIDRDWRTYLDRKVVHFAYFYVLWLIIQFGFKAPGIAAEGGVEAAVGAFAMAFIEPFGTMWFIYLLPIFLVVAKATRGVPWWIIWLIGAALEALPIHTGWILVDEFAARFVYFYTGYIFAPHIFRLADLVIERRMLATAFLAGWAVVNGLIVFKGFADLPGMSLALGLFGAAAVVALSALLSKSDLMRPIRYCGAHSIVIYLAFFLPMALSRALLFKLGVVTDIGTISLLVTAAGVVAPLLLFAVVRGTRFAFLFERPGWARLGSRQRALAPAE